VYSFSNLSEPLSGGNNTSVDLWSVRNVEAGRNHTCHRSRWHDMHTFQWRHHILGSANRARCSCMLHIPAAT